MKNRFRHLMVSVVTLALGIVANAHNAHAQADYDGDGLDDFQVIQVSKSTRANAGTTSWFIRNSSNGSVRLIKFNIPGDAFVRVRGRPAVVWVKAANEPLVWQVSNEDGSISQFVFGSPGDTVPNSIGDPTVVRNQADGTLLWYRYLRSGQIVSTVLGKTGDLVGTETDGQIVALRAGFLWFAKEFFGTTLTQDNDQWGLPGDVPIISSNPLQRIVARYSSGQLTMYVKNNDPNRTTFVQPLPAGTNVVPNAGYFFANAQQAGPNHIDFGWHDRTNGLVGAFNTLNGGTVFFPFGLKNMYIMTSSGEVIPPNTNGAFDGGGGGGGGGGGSGGGSPPSGSCGGLPVVGINSLRGVLWKAENIHGGRGASFLVQNAGEDPNSRVLIIKATNCVDIARVCLYAKDAPFAFGGRYYAGTCGANFNKSGQQIASLARAQNGSSSFFVQGRNKWVRVDNFSRDGNIAK